jgi:hypothetical protein
MDILIVICVCYRDSNTTGGKTRSENGQAPARCSGIQNDGMQKLIAAGDKEKAAQRTINT